MKCPTCGEQQPDGSRTCANCGRLLLQPIALRQFALSDESGRSFPLRSGITRIGREPSSNEIVLMDPSVNSRHAAIEVSPQAVVIRDLGSSSGTLVNGAAIHKAALLEPGDRISFGDREFSITRQLAERPPAPRGIPTPLPQTQRRQVPAHENAHLPATLATIAFTLLATMLHSVGLIDGVEREALPLPLVLMLVGLVALPLTGIVLLAAGRRSGYLVTALSALAGIAFVAVAGPIFAGGTLRDEITAEYGSNGFWFIAITAILALIAEILVLTVSIAGWRMLQPGPSAGAPAAAR